MKSLRALPVAHSIAAAGVLAAALALPFRAAQAQDKAYEMKISTPTIHDVPDTFGANFLAAVEKTPAAASRAKSIRRASLARSRDRSKVRSSAPFNAP